MTLGAAAVAELLRRHEVRPRRSLGQHFVIDPNTVKRIVRLAGVAAGERIVEIGPGCGALTVALTDAGATVLAVEVDGRLVAALAEVCDGRPVEVVYADAAELAAWAPRLVGAESWRLVANLPYNIAVPLLLDILAGLAQIRAMLVMVQAEVAERLAARPGQGAYGLPSLKLACWARAEILGRVPPTVFWPRPRVSSALLAIDRLPEPAADNIEDLYRLARRAFGQRRKMLRASLRGVVAPTAFASAGVDPAARPAELAVADWSRLAAEAAGAEGPSAGAGRERGTAP
ncbi:MAG: 16S rRNA (adenine(1518)-N(6)/adenine(1519)-N(6))-dimethyltransferase RsmA [bacterium]|nr:16S rRNA (adenine(1518)-N(6)/adenine(1519)-N(6))-dimethyltransferase RsmA [bacterium]MDE0669171.1 16S rRNA (adenine(1518)-N(6)/adenine(1519)-N(6))-dimethyltransferase RsmA [bacterium]MXZ30519.1 16S rRNA (adenine(1518)-N(6)/adenine(1519)-N(6))-dimethyltransferase RsmA [Acidimicrobiia bacterium]MXZ31033.1 16S rRNA (adenine(1518)-N(6)/adenine(1519)-N(6))-dimethyltransferase RsmA [Acidimicrobiia bacterium]MYB24006.1 16S rRNA (adenine(1518)-N(6)/adenine(1519)-N(6))-dimethyltransferase RsmA [Acidi